MNQLHTKLRHRMMLREDDLAAVLAACPGMSINLNIGATPSGEFSNALVVSATAVFNNGPLKDLYGASECLVRDAGDCVSPLDFRIGSTAAVVVEGALNELMRGARDELVRRQEAAR